MVIWLTGLSGSGKTTLGEALRGLISGVAPVIMLDGDAVRVAVDDGLGYAEADRVVQIGRLARLARLLAEQGIVVIVAAVYADQGLLDWNRDHLPGYLEVHLAASMETLAQRDPKGIYARARSGEMRNVVGVDIPWVPPSAPDLTLDLDRPASPERLARLVVDAIPGLAARVEMSAAATP